MNVGGPCSEQGCRRSSIYNSEYCFKHHKKSSSIIWYEIDGNRNNIESKEIDGLISLLKQAKKFWIVDLTIDDKEFVQYAIERGELEHWDKLEMIESMEMTPDEAFNTLRTKITGDYSGHELWWAEVGKNKNESAVELEENEKYAPQLIVAVAIPIVIFLGYAFVQNPGVFVGELCIQITCGAMFLGGGAGVSALGRSDTGKFE